jgi:hypothetical protein
LSTTTQLEHAITHRHRAHMRLPAPRCRELSCPYRAVSLIRSYKLIDMLST